MIQRNKRFDEILNKKKKIDGLIYNHNVQQSNEVFPVAGINANANTIERKIKKI